jgi:hypothetical protein
MVKLDAILCLWWFIYVRQEPNKVARQCLGRPVAATQACYVPHGSCRSKTERLTARLTSFWNKQVADRSGRISQPSRIVHHPPENSCVRVCILLARSTLVRCKGLPLACVRSRVMRHFFITFVFASRYSLPFNVTSNIISRGR